MTDDYAAGREAPAEALNASLRRASAEYLDGALANAALQPHHLLMIVRNPAITPALLQRVGRSPVWMRQNRLRVALVLHPRTPTGTALPLISFLRWGDLARVSVAPRLSVALRQAAEKILLLRLPELEVGERVTLARVGTPAVIKGMCRDGNPLVVRALLDNPRMQGDDVLSIAGRGDSPPTVLRAVAESSRFASLPEVQLALASNPQTPTPVGLRVVSVLDRSALEAVLGEPNTPPLVRIAAERRLLALPA